MTHARDTGPRGDGRTNTDKQKAEEETALTPPQPERNIVTTAQLTIATASPP